MNSPLVSIIVPVYNVERYLQKCLDSIQAQTFTDFEAVLVDDGSTDGSGRICDEYATKDSRFIVVHKQNEGVAKARITAFEHSNGDYITFIDSDDFVDKDYLRAMMKMIEKFHVDMASCLYYTYNSGRTHTTKRNVIVYYDRKSLDNVLKTQFLYDPKTKCAGIPIALWGKIIKREYVQHALEIGNGLKWSEDQIGVFDMLIHIHSFYAVKDCLYYYVKRQGQVTKAYTSDFWPHQLEAYNRYIQLDTKNLLENQLHIRTWLFTIKAGILKRMPLAISDYHSFNAELKKIENHISWKRVFSHTTTKVNLKNDIMFWILKFKLYRLFYLLFYRRKLNH